MTSASSPDHGIVAETAWFASHELRTPLNAIRSASELIIDGSCGPVPETIRDVVQLIADASRELDGHFDALDRLARINGTPQARQAIAPRDLLAPWLSDDHPLLAVTSPVLVDVAAFHRALDDFIDDQREKKPGEFSILGDTPDDLIIDCQGMMPDVENGHGSIRLEVLRQTLERSGVQLRHMKPTGTTLWFKKVSSQA